MAAPSQAAVPHQSPQVTLLKRLIWAYLILLLIEGALRKWALPSLAQPLLIVRDPVVILIYIVAAGCRRFVFNGYVIACLLLAVGSFLASLMVPDLDIRVPMIGLRCYFLHLPMMFVMERTLNAEDIWRMGKFLFWFIIPETILVVLQFRAPQTAWVNLSVGGEVTAGMSGALGHFRPSGTFSFVTGVAAIYPLVLAMLLGYLLNQRKLPWYLSVATMLCIPIAVLASISRTNAMTCAVVLLAAGGGMMFMPKPPLAIMRIVLIAGIAALITSYTPQFNESFQESADAFASRWDDSTGKDIQGFRSNIVGRFFSDLIPDAWVFEDAPTLGYGMGLGTNMAQGLLTGKRNFALGEAEWPRLILEMGPVFGLCFIALRIGLCWRIVQKALAALRQQNILPLLFGVEAFLLVLNAQWSQPTTQGFATFSAGLVFAAARMTVTKPSTAAAKMRYRAPRKPSWEPLPENQAIPRLPTQGTRP